MYCDLVASKPEVSKGGNAAHFWFLSFKDLQAKGFKFLVSRASNPVSSKMMVSFGCQVIKKVHLKPEALKNEYMELVLLEFSKMVDVSQQKPRL